MSSTKQGAWIYVSWYDQVHWFISATVNLVASVGMFGQTHVWHWGCLTVINGFVIGSQYRGVEIMLSIIVIMYFKVVHMYA